MKKNVCRLIFASLLICSGMKAGAQIVGNCTVNAGGNAIVCGSFTTLTGTVSGNVGAAAPLWTFVSGPVTPVIVSPNSLTTDVNGMTVDGNYTFRLQQACAIGFNTSQVVITAHARPASFTAGPDITDVCAAAGTTSLGGVIPAGYTGEWRAVNIWRFYRASETVSTNAQFSSTTSANPVFSLVNKANHGIDPAYWAILRITSADGVCSYEDTTVVRFIPNPVINPVVNTSRCQSPTISTHYITLSAPPYFNTNYPGVAGAAAAGTTISLNVISQPAGANMSFDRLDDNIFFYFNGVTQPGTYTFTITVTNSCGTYTSPTLTYSFQGVTPRLVNLQPAGHEAPEQLVVYATSGSGGEVHCNIAGTTAPQSFYFSVDPADPPTVITTVTPSGIIPAGGPPTVTVTGTGTYDRVVTATPPAGGWRIGTYRFTINTRNADGSCGVNQTYYIHVSDRSRPDVEIADVSVCYPGTGAISATITLPDVYKGIVNGSYFQDFDGHYDIQLVSAPAGAAPPTYTTTNLRSLTSTSTVISNLNRIGNYSFRITPIAYNPSVGPFLAQEYACSGALMSDTFLVRVEGLINANAGSDQVLGNVTSASLAGNNPGLASGVWTLVASPAGSAPQLSAPNSPLTTATNLNIAGAYDFAWTITTPYGGCVSADTVRIVLTTTLDVRWLYFNAENNVDKILLTWGTASEQNNRGFDVEKSKDGIAWQTAGFVNSLASAGNSDQPLNYRFTDNHPFDGVNYYRLKQHDLDERYAYSSVKKVTRPSYGQVQLLPNPVQDKLTVTGLKNIASIQLLNSYGQVVKTLPGNAATTVYISFTELPAGLYIVKTTDHSGTTTQYKIIKR
ncbi:T9SS type A sorting domain-containing protein [Terrimonas ferruginea]|uniref:T9SS type A sorting domain-containing protein n=1 Tax=Terrimonas ferruginea TaxID=249 RepID=UPI0004283EF2|nr:T9SS type A sorting domain-containing protein [Terrimonas ferruginea]